jgi:hypothetical protein
MWPTILWRLGSQGHIQSWQSTWLAQRRFHMER